MKIYINKPNESWIVDRFVDEFKTHNPDSISEKIKDSDIIWIISPWTWNKVPKKDLKQKKVICTVHHIDEEKFSGKEGDEFYKLDKFVDYYHAISNKTFNQLKKLTNKKIYTVPFWINQNIWFEKQDKNSLRSDYKINKEVFCIGSFQRDTEGKGKRLPKLSKGPDRFIEIAKHFNNNMDVAIILTGYRRDYLIHELEKLKIKYYYFDKATQTQVNDLYNCLDLYVVSSRVEGGPQAILECAITKTPIISTDVGIASQILSKTSIFDMENYQKASPNPEYALKNIEKYKLPNGFILFKKMFEEII